MAYVGINFVIGEVCFNVSLVVTHVCLGERVNLGCFRFYGGSHLVRGLPRLSIVLSIFLRAETEAPAASRFRFVGARL
jgi:hypothetical protein